MKERKRRNNLIITCGTSQLDSEKLEKKKGGIGVLNSTLLTLKSLSNEVSVSDESTQSAWEDLQNRILNQSGFPIIDEYIGKENNPFSAEISTLAKMKTRPIKPQWKPTEDCLVLIASDSSIGLFARELLKRILIHSYGIPNDKHHVLTPAPVGDLNENTSNPDDAMINLAVQVYENLRKQDEQIEWNNILVMTGGFKSTVPCLTVFSLLYGVELVYLFEKSTELQSLHPAVNLKDASEKKAWQNIWNDLKKTRWANNTCGYLQIALNGRLEDPNAVYAI